MVRPNKADLVFDFRRQQILDAARRNFVRQGVADSTVDSIAKTAGVAKGTVYLYFKSKDEILRQVLIGDLEEFHAETVAIIAAPGPIEDRVRRFIHAELAFFERKRDFFEHCHFEMSADGRKKAKQRLGVVFADQTAAWRTALADASADGMVTVADLDGAARSIVALVHGLALQRLRGWQAGSIDETVEASARLVLQGVMTR
jgi:AcrR family transcriptional regulator